MNKIKSLAELNKIREESQINTALRTMGENPDHTVIMVGMATCGIAAGARAVMVALLDEMSRNGLNDVFVIATGCPGLCYAEPLVEVRVPGQAPIAYGNVNEALARDIISKHVMQGVLLDNIIVNREVARHE